MITYKIGNQTTLVAEKQFKDGCMNVNINTGGKEVNTNLATIVVTLQFGDEFSINDNLFALAQTVDALKHQYPFNVMHLRMPYIPYARQDRPCNNGESFSLRVLGDFINSLGFNTVSVLDPHSTVANGVIRNMHASDQFTVFGKIKPSWGNTFIVAPDAGAVKKCEDFAKKAGAKGVFTCIKNRNPETMEIEGVRVLEPVPFKSELFILDDLIDGGRTFIELAKELKSKYDPSVIELAASHGLFTYGTECVADQFDKVYTTNSYISNKANPKVKVVDIFKN